MKPKKSFPMDLIIGVLKEKNYQVFSRPFELNLIGIRNSNTKSNDFDDTICIFYYDKKQKLIFDSKAFTTDPGQRYLYGLINPKGTAILVPGQYLNTYSIDLHNGKYMALCERLGPVRVYRDKDRDNILDYDESTIEKGMFGINIHRARSSRATPTVEGHSAGCQVFQDIDDFDEMMKLAFQQKELYGNRFTYTLLQENDLWNSKFAKSSDFLKDVAPLNIEISESLKNS